MELIPAIRSWSRLRMFQGTRANVSMTVIALSVLVAVSAVLRFYNLDWDSGHFFHPDERNIANAVAKVHFFSQLNPEFFAYGGFPVYLYRLAVDLAAFLTNDPSWAGDWGKINIIGRFFSALFSTLTTIPIFLLARELFDRRAAALAAALYAFTVASIQTAHYSVTESLITLIGVLIALGSVRFLKETRPSYAIVLGAIVGIGVASKTAAVSFAVMPMAAGLAALPPLVRRFGIVEPLKAVASDLAVVGLTAFAVFAALSPYTFLAFDKFAESMTYESGVVTGSRPVPYTLQFDQTAPYLFQISNLIWQLGPAAIICVAAFGAVLVAAIRTRDMRLLVFCAFPLLYFLYIGAWHTKFVRYMVPVIPFLIISCAGLLTWLISRWRLLGNAVAALVVAITICWAIAFTSIYTRPQTRIAASEWIYQNITPGSKIFGEHWDDGLPVAMGSLDPGRYQIDQLTIYEPDDNRKVPYLAANLAIADYIVLNSRRLYGTLMHLQDKYPISSIYYQLLFDGKLGYQKVAEFASYPSLLGLTINDDSSEETFQVYDHPKVLIFQNVDRYDVNTLAGILSGAVPAAGRAGSSPATLTSSR